MRKFIPLCQSTKCPASLVIAGLYGVFVVRVSPKLARFKNYKHVADKNFVKDINKSNVLVSRNLQQTGPNV